MDGLRIMDILTSNDFDYDVQKYNDHYEVIINCYSTFSVDKEEETYRGRNDKDRYNIIPVIVISFTNDGRYLNYDFTQIIEKVEKLEEVEIPEEIK